MRGLASKRYRLFIIVHSSLVNYAKEFYGNKAEIIDEQAVNAFGVDRKMFNPRSAFEHIQAKNKKRGVA